MLGTQVPDAKKNPIKPNRNLSIFRKQYSGKLNKWKCKNNKRSVHFFRVYSFKKIHISEKLTSDLFVCLCVYQTGK